MARMSDAEVMELLRDPDSPLNVARARFSHHAAMMEQAGQQRITPSPIEVRRMEIEAAINIIGDFDKKQHEMMLSGMGRIEVPARDVTLSSNLLAMEAALAQLEYLYAMVSPETYGKIDITVRDNLKNSIISTKYALGL